LWDDPQKSSFDLDDKEDGLMRLQFGTTDELTNTQFAPVAALMAYYEIQKVLEPLQSVTSAAPKGDFTPA
jgi:hypothetical protein